MAYTRSVRKRPRVLVCRTVPEYAASLLDRRVLERELGASTVPLFSEGPADDQVRQALGNAIAGVPYSASPSLGSVRKAAPRALLARLVTFANDNAPKRAHVCAVVEGDAFAVFGAAHAILARKRLVVLRNLQGMASGKALADVASLTLVVSTLRLGAIGIDPLRDRIMQLGIRRFGVLTASNTTRLSNLIARTAMHEPFKQPTGAIYQVGPSGAPTLDRLVEVALPNRPSEEVRTLANTGTPFAVFIGHGRSYCSLSGNLCSRTEPADATDTRCIRDYTCVFPGAARTPARDLRAAFALTDSCSTLSFSLIGPELDVGMNLGVHLTDGYAVGVVGPNNTNVVSHMSPYYLWNLLERGFSFGEACARLSDVTGKHLGTRPPYLLLGDPEIQPFVQRREAMPKALKLLSTDDDEAAFQISTAKGRVAAYTCDAAAVRKLADQGLLNGILEKSLYDHALIEVLPPKPKTRHVEVIVAWSARVKQARSELLLTTRPPFRADLIEMAGQISENARFEKRWLESPTAANLDALLLDVENPVANGRNLPVVEPQHYANLRGVENATVALGHQVGKELLSSALTMSWSRNVWPRNHYAGVHGARDDAERRNPLSTTCPRCRALAREFPYQVGLWPARRRVLLECETCMFLYDVEQGSAPLLLDSPEDVESGKTFQVRFVVKNALPRIASVHAAIAFDRISNPREVFGIKPLMRDGFLEAGEERLLEFDVRLRTSITPHMFHAKALVFINGSLSWTMRKMRVRAPSRKRG